MAGGIERLRAALIPTEAGHYLIGLSGGADSVALLTLLLADAASGRIRLEAVHVNHGLRGPESDGDEAFCAKLCAEKGIPFYACRVDLAGRTDEDAARTARFSVFRKYLEERRAEGLILAHHADDQAETFLMRLLRGAGPEGLGCMKPDETIAGVRILRPMLGIRREAIREALRQDGIAWREDSTNLDRTYLRNRVRLELLPALESAGGQAVGKICRAAGLIGRDSDALQERAENLLEQLADGRTLRADLLAAEPAAVRCRVLRHWWDRNVPPMKEHALSAACTEAFDGLLRKERGKINLPADMHAVRAGKYLFLTGGEPEPPEPAEVTVPETAFGDFRLTVGSSEGEPGDGKRTQEVPEDLIRGCIIRTRKPGDRIRPFGSTGSRKLQDYLTDRRVPEPFRDRIPLLCRGGEVLLAAGVGAGDVPRWNGGKGTVRLTWHGEMPWAE